MKGSGFCLHSRCPTFPEPSFWPINVAISSRRPPRRLLIHKFFTVMLSFLQLYLSHSNGLQVNLEHAHTVSGSINLILLTCFTRGGRALHRMMKPERTTKERSRRLPLRYLWRVGGVRIGGQLATQSLGLGQCVDRIGHCLRQAVVVVIYGVFLDYQIRSDLLPPVSSPLVIWKLGVEKLLKVPA